MCACESRWSHLMFSGVLSSRHSCSSPVYLRHWFTSTFLCALYVLPVSGSLRVQRLPPAVQRLALLVGLISDSNGPVGVSRSMRALLRPSPDVGWEQRR